MSFAQPLIEAVILTYPCFVVIHYKPVHVFYRAPRCISSKARLAIPCPEALPVFPLEDRTARYCMICVKGLLADRICPQKLALLTLNKY